MTKNSTMEAIVKVWFEGRRIYIHTDQGNTYSRPLEAFPLLLEATPAQRNNYQIGIDGDDIRWDDIDEDIHISSFYETVEPDTNNPIAAVFRRFPQLNVSEMARTIGINKSLLSRYIYGIKKPSASRQEQILESVRRIGREMSALDFLKSHYPIASETPSYCLNDPAGSYKPDINTSKLVAGYKSHKKKGPRS